MKVGDYVRNKHGIAKIVGIEKKNNIDVIEFDKPICFLINKNTGETKKERFFNKLPITKNIDIKKLNTSPNIIDLIEENDYINGLRVEKNKYGDLYTSYTYMGGLVGTQEETYTTFLKDYENDYIQSIVTKEQFKDIEYEVK